MPMAKHEMRPALHQGALHPYTVFRYEAGRSVQADTKADDAAELKKKKIEKDQVCPSPRKPAP